MEVRYNERIGDQITIQQLRDEYDAVLISIGASTDKKMGIEGEQAESVVSAVHFLREVGLGCSPHSDPSWG